MPLRRKNRKKRYRKKRQLLAPLPMKLLSKQNYYASTKTLDPGAGGLCAVTVFRANGMFDPDQTGGGHQPRGFDQIIAMYDHYTVIGSKIRVTFVPNTATTAGIQVGITLMDSTTTKADSNDYQEHGYTVSKILAPGSSNGGVVTLEYNFNNKFLGYSHPLNVSNLKGSVSTSPGEGAFFHVWASAMDSANEAAIRIAPKIEYIAVFTEPKIVDQS